MDEKYIQDLFNNLGGESKFGKFNDFKLLLSTDKKYRRDFYDAFGEKTLGLYNDFDELVKKKEITPSALPPSEKSTQLPSQLPTVKEPSIKEKFGQFYMDLGKPVASSTYVKPVREKSIEEFDVAKIKAEKEKRNVEVKQKAIETTATRRLKAKKEPITEQTLNKEKQQLQKDIDNGDVILTNDNKGEKIYGRQPGAGETFIRGLKSSVDALGDAATIAYTKATGTPEDLASVFETISWRKKRDSEKQFSLLDLDPMVSAARSYTETTDLPTAEPSTMGAFTGFAGAIAPDIALAAATGGAGQLAKMGALGTKFYTSAYGTKAHELYEIGKKELIDKGVDEREASVLAAQAATKNAQAAAIPEAALNTLFFSGKLHSPAANNFVSVMKGAAKDAIKVGTLGAISSASTSAIESAQGYNVDNWFEEMLGTGGEFAKIDLLFKVLPILRTLPKAAQSAVKEFAVDPVVKPLVEAQFKNLPQYVDVMRDLDMYEQATKDLRGIVPEEKMASIGGRVQKRINRINEINKAKEEIKELEKKKETLPETLHEEVDNAIRLKEENIKSLQKEIGNVDIEIEQVKKSKGTGIEMEVDEKTGEPILGEKTEKIETEQPITETGVAGEIKEPVPTEITTTEKPTIEEGVQPSAEPTGQGIAERTPTVLEETKAEQPTISESPALRDVESTAKDVEPTSLRGVKYSDIVVGDKYLEDILSDNKLSEDEKQQVREIFARGVDYFKFDKEGEQKFQEKFSNPEDITDVADIIAGLSSAQESAFDFYNTKNYDNVKDAVNYIVSNPNDYSPKVVKAVNEIKQKLDNPSSSMNRLYAIDVIKELGLKPESLLSKEQAPAEVKAEVKPEEPAITKEEPTTPTEPIKAEEKVTVEEGKGAGEEPPKPPVETEKKAIYVEPKRTVFSHRGLQEVSTEFGLDDVTPREKKTDLQLFREVDDILTEWKDKGTYNENISKLVERAKEKKPFNDQENLIMAQHIAQLREQGARAREQFGIDSKEYNDKLKEINEAIRLGESVRSSQGAALRVPIFARRYSATLEDAMTSKMQALGVDELPSKVKDEVIKLHEQIDKTNKEFETYRQEAEKKFADMQAQIELNSLAKEKSTGGKVKGEKKSYSEQRKGYIEELKKAAEEYKAAGKKMGIAADGGAESFVISAKIAKIIMKIVGTHVGETGNKLSEIVEKTYNDVKDIFEGITERDVRDVISGKYNVRKQTANEIQAELRNIRTEQKLIDEYEKLRKGEEPSDTKKAIKRNQDLAELREKIDAIKRERRLGEYSDEELANKIIERNKKREEELKKKVREGDFEKKKKPETFWESKEFQENNPELYKKILDSYAKKEDAQAEFDVSLLKDQESRKGKFEKGVDWLGAGINTTKKLVTGVDDSYLFMQSLAALFIRPVIGAKAVKAHVIDAISKKNYQQKLAELHNSPDWPFLQKIGINITEPKSLSVEKAEEALAGKTWDIRFKHKGKEYKILSTLLSPFERAATSLGNNLRIIAARSLSEKYFKEGYTYENNPKLFEDLATMLNTETGRGKQNEWIKKGSELVTAGIWSPQLMASRLNLLGISDFLSLGMYKLGTKGYYRQLSPEIRKEAIKGLIKFSTTVLSLSYLGAYIFGGKVDDNPTSPTFLDIKMPDGKSYNMSGGFSQYIRLVAQSVYWGRTKEGVFEKFQGVKDPGSNLLHFLRGKLTPATGAIIDVYTGKDYSGKPVTLMGEIGRLTIPMSLQNVASDIKKDGLSALFTSTLPSFVGITVKDKRDLTNYTFNDKTREFLKKYQIPTKFPSSKYVNKKGEEIEMTEDEYNKYLERVSERVNYSVADMEKKGITAKEKTQEAYKKAFDLILSDAKEFAKYELFGIYPKKESIPVAPKGYRQMPIDKKIKIK